MSTTLASLGASAVAYDLADRACITVIGADASSWLNGVLTCDVALASKAGGTFACYGCALDVKGKLLADAIAIGEPTRLEVFVPRSAASKLLAMWDGFVVMEDCALAIDDARALVLVQGAGAAEVARRAGQASVAFDDLGYGGVAITVEAVKRAEVIDALVAAGATPLALSDAQRLHVEAGRATWGVDVDATNYVQEAALEHRAVSFNKGCYLGQEVVCMLQMRGKVHRKLARVQLDRAVERGAEVTLEGAVVGKITSVDGARALALIKTSAIAAGKAIDVGGVTGTVLGEAG